MFSTLLLGLVALLVGFIVLHFPGADQGSFLTGTAGVELPLRENFTVRTKFLLPRLKQYGAVTGYTGPLMSEHVVRSADAEVNVMVFQQLSKPNLYNSFKHFVGRGLFTLNLDDWATERKKMVHAFSDKCAREQLESTRTQISRMLDKFGIYNIHEEFKYVLLDAVTSWNFNVSFDAINHPERKEVKNLMNANKALEELALQYYIPFRKFLAKDKAKMAADVVSGCRSIGLNVIRDGVKSVGDLEDRSNKTIFHQMLRIEGVKENDLLEHALTFIIAGHETSASGAATTIYKLATHPEILAKAQAEVDAVMVNETVPSSSRPLTDFPYLTMCVKEAMRMESPANYVDRVMDKTITLKGYTFEKEGTIVGVDIHSTHFNPEYYPQPHVFRPERFDKEAEASLPKGAYIPFALGARNCIGYRLALFSMVLLTAAVLKNFDIESLNTPKYRRMFVGEPDAIRVQLTPRSI